MADSSLPAQTDKRVMILLFLLLTVLVKFEKFGRSVEFIESSNVEELIRAKEQMRWVNRAEFMSEMGISLPE